MKGYLITLNLFYIRCNNFIYILTINEKRCIFMANARTFYFKTDQRVDVDVEEECLKRKMAEKYDLNITMTVYQIENWRKYIRFWFRMSGMSQRPLIVLIILNRKVI